MIKPKSIRVFEYEHLLVGVIYNDVEFKKKHFDALVKLNELHDNKYFTVGHKRIIFKQYVGILQVADVCIEVLPKADRSSANKDAWQNALIEMLKATRRLKINQVDQANVNSQSKHLLDIYFGWYLNEVRHLMRRGLIKKYYRKQGNLNSLKGKLVFAKQISQNLIHKERFYTEYQIYDKDHLIHQVLCQALGIIEQFTRGSYLYGACKTVQLDFPEVKSIQAKASTFEKIILGRKTQSYATALEIARLIILNFAPNIKSGSEKMIALLFDMNNLWEEYILEKLRRALRNTNYSVYGQRSKLFWGSISIRPDIIIKDGENTHMIIDTKWKVVSDNKPSVQDLRQMYVYNEYWDAKQSLLLYPGKTTRFHTLGAFHPIKNEIKHQCGLAWVNILDSGGGIKQDLEEELLSIVVSN